MRLVHGVLWAGLSGVLAAQAPIRFLGDATETAGQLVAGDFDGDGDVDFVSGTALLVNDGHANFAVAAGSPTPTSNSTLDGALAADFDGDGRADLLEDVGGIMGVRLSLGGGAFGPLIPLPPLPAPPTAVTAATPVAADVGDVDADGDLDLLLGTVTFQAPFLAIYQDAFGLLLLNNGNGSFVVAPAASFAPSVAAAGVCYLRDLDGDGDLDAVFAEPYAGGTALVQTRSNVGGAFSPAVQPSALPAVVRYTVCEDFDGDGSADLVGADAANTLFVCLGGAFGLGGATFAGSGFIPLDALDLNADGAAELVCLEGGLLTTRGFVGGAFSLPSVVEGPFYFVADPSDGTGLRSCARFGADLDGDGDRDAVLRNGRSPVRLLNDGAGALRPQHGRSGPHASQEPIYGDFDGDGDLDVAAADYASQALVVSLNDGDGVFTAGPVTSGASLAWSPIYFTLVAFDRDGDGDDDLYCARNLLAPTTPPALVGTDLVLDNTGSGAFVVVATPPTTQPVYKGVAFDADGDGDDDLVLARRTPTTTSNGVGPLPLYLQNLGAGGLAAPVTFGVAQRSLDLVVADFDADGDLDLFQSNGAVSLPPAGFVAASHLHLNGGGTFTTVAQPGIVGGFAAAGDLDADGDADVVLDGQTYYAAGGTLTPGAPLASPLGNRGQLADLDLDGDLDLLESPCTIMMNGGGGVFGAPISVAPRFAAAATSWLLPASQAVDLDRDGDFDVVAPPHRVYSNVVRHLTTVGTPRVGRPERVDFYGTPGGAWFLYVAPATTDFVLPGYGTLLIDPLTAQLAGFGLLPPATAAFGASVGLGFAVPNVPALAGLSLYWQGVDGATSRFTNRLTTTIAGY